MTSPSEDPSLEPVVATSIRPEIGAEAVLRVDPKLLEILVCPVTRGPLTYDSVKQELVSPQAKLAYPIRDGIPIMLPEEARPLD